jgi:hypothetical protein
MRHHPPHSAVIVENPSTLAQYPAWSYTECKQLGYRPRYRPMVQVAQRPQIFGCAPAPLAWQACAPPSGSIHSSTCSRCLNTVRIELASALAETLRWFLRIFHCIGM